MTTTAIKAATVSAVLLPDQRWHDVEPESFKLTGYRITDSEHAERTLHPDNADAGFTFVEKISGATITGPLASVLSLRHRP